MKDKNTPDYSHDSTFRAKFDGFGWLILAGMIIFGQVFAPHILRL